jgi:hypothetical protein
MATVLFSKGREGFLDGSLDWDTNDFRVMLVKSTYTFDDTDVFLADLGSVDNGRTAALGSKTVTSGVADAADITLTATSAVACNALIIFKHTGSDATARLVAYIDSAGATGFPITPAASATISIVFSNGANKIFKL